MSTDNSYTSVPHLRILSEEQAKAIHNASLMVLEQTGYQAPVKEARDLLRLAGARIDGMRTFIPAYLVEQALTTVRPATVYNRLGEPIIYQGRVTFGAAADTFYVLDPYKRKVRPFIIDDLQWIATVLDGLPNIDWIFCAGNAHDAPNDLQIQIAVAECLQCTTKPIMAYPADQKGLIDILEICYEIAGGKEAFTQRPFFFCGTAPAGPLSGSDYSIKVLLTCAELEVPLLSFALPAMGANSPCSITGHIVLANADWLAALVIHQLKRPGAPICNGGFSAQVMDMRTTVWSYSAPEVHLACSIIADLAHWYKLPAMGMVMEPDTPHLDAQAGAEMAAHCLWAMLSGVELVRCIGRTGAGKLISAEASVLADEIIDYTRAAVKPVSMVSDEIAQYVELIDKVGPLGTYIGQKHTRQNYRDFWYPKIFTRSNFDPQSLDLVPNLVNRLNERVRQLLENHHPEPLTQEVLAAINSLEANWFIKYKT